MNQARNSIHGGGEESFGHDAPTTNPFTADLKGEFTSNFGTNTNAVSQIFKEGGFVNDKKKIYIAVGGILLLIAAAAYFLMPTDNATVSDESMSEAVGGEDMGMMDDLGADPMLSESAPGTPGDAAAVPAENAVPTAATEPVAATQAAVEPSAVSGALAVVAPADGQTRAYDEASEPAVFQWQGPANHLVFAFDKGMQQVMRRVNVTDRQSYEFLNPHPGTWYWQLQGPDGVTEPRSFTISTPERLNLVIGQPSAGGAIAGNGGMVSWTAPHTRVAFYRVEFSAGGSFAKPDFRFASSGTNVTLNGVTPGTYQVRLGGFSEVSGQWEYANPITVTIQ